MAIHESVLKPGIEDKSTLPKPSLPIVNTAMLIEIIGEEWRMPTYEEIKRNEDFPVSLSTSPGRLIGQWMKFFDLVEKGNKIVENTVGEGVVEVDLSALEAWKYAREVLGGKFEQRKEMIAAAKRAFQVLLGVALETEPGDPEQARELVKAFENHLVKESSVASAEAKMEKI